MALEDVFPDFAAARAQSFAGISCAKPTIMIAMTARTGSTYLCTSLHQAGQSTEPTEIFNPRGPAQLERDRRHTADFASYLASLAAGPDATFIFKSSWLDIIPFAPALTRVFPQLRVIYLDRKNIAAQAVSQFRAELSGIWHRRPGQAAQTFDPSGKFDLARISAIMANMEREKQNWEGWFAAHHITPLRLEYRLIESDVKEALRRIASTMNLPLHPEHVTSAGMLKLADAASAEWTEHVQKHLFNMT